MLLCTLSALSSLVELKERLEGDEIDLGNASAILNAVQNIAQQGAALSRYFWPMHNREPHLAGAKQLRIGLKVPDDGPLRDRTLRNQMEHFDEELDRFCRTTVVGHTLPQYVGPLLSSSSVPLHLFRAYLHGPRDL